MKIKNVLLLLWVMTQFHDVIKAQEKLGVMTDARLPVNQSRMNPALMVDQKPWLSVNLIGAHAFARSNFFSIDDSRLGFGFSESDFSYSEPSKNGKAFLHTEVMGPSATVNVRRHAFGFHSLFRLYGNVNKMPSVLGQIIGDGGVDGVQDGNYVANNARAKAMAWTEFGLSYGTIVYQRNTQMLNVAGSINRIIGIQHANFIIDNAQVEVLNGNGTLRELDGKYSYADPAWGAGKGWSMNLGANYKRSRPKDVLDDYYPHSKKSGCKPPTYLYTIGVSLIDLGYSRFTESSRTSFLPDTATVDDLEDGVDEALGIEKGRFTAMLPTALAIQADYRYSDYLFISANLIQKVSFPNSFGVERANVLGITPRFESSWLSVGLPLSMANYVTPQLGLYFRLGPLAIGTDHLSPFILKRDIKAADLYVYLNIPLSKSPECRNRDARSMDKWICPVW